MSEDAAWEQVARLFQSVIDRPVEERAQALQEMCGDDDALRRDVESLLAAHAEAEECRGWPAIDASLLLATGGDDSAPELPTIAALQPGVRLKEHQVVELIGRGGMGEVYRARNVDLNRDVALKVLPKSLVGDPHRIALLRREARVLATLNHPNICGIYGLTETEEGQLAVILELIDGETLAERIARGPVPMSDAIEIAQQIVDALEAAHEQGIIHRDLKPSNIKLRADGRVKVLDFGLAKQASPGRDGQPLDAAVHSGPLAVIGTAAYMSPQHVRGGPVDKRTDIWAFGCVLFELLTGERAFRRDSLADTLAAVLEAAPPWEKLPSNAPRAVRELLRRCLEPDAKQRLRDVGEARIVFDALAVEDTPIALPPIGGRNRTTWWMGLAAAGVVTGVVTGAAIWSVTHRRPTFEAATAFATRMTITPTSPARLSAGGDGMVAVSPDGARVAYIAGTANSLQVFVRLMNELVSRPVSQEHSRLASLSFSPDGEWVTFFSESEFALKKVAVSGGAEVTLVHPDSYPFGTTWGIDGNIVYSNRTGLWRVADSGGTPMLLTARTGPEPFRRSRWFLPDLLPGGRAVLVTVQSATNAADSQIVALDLRTGEQSVVVRRGIGGHYVDGGYLVYASDDGIYAVSFDKERLQARGKPIRVVPRIVALGGELAFNVAKNGTLAYVGGGGASTARELLWVARDGKETPITAPARLYLHPRISPDGTELLVDALDDGGDTWNWDFAQRTMTRVTFGPGRDLAPVWAPAGHRMVFQSDGDGVADLFLTAADGSGVGARLTQGSDTLLPTSFSPDGRQLMFTRFSTGSPPALMALKLDASGLMRPLLGTAYGTAHGEVSPDGRWLAYVSWESSRAELHVRPFHDLNAQRWQVSVRGGGQPAWSRNSRELFYRDRSGALMGVSVGATGSWRSSAPRELVKAKYFFESFTAVRTYDVAPDGSRFLMIKDAHRDIDTEPAHLVVVQNWIKELNQLISVQ